MPSWHRGCSFFQRLSHRLHRHSRARHVPVTGDLSLPRRAPPTRCWGALSACLGGAELADPATYCSRRKGRVATPSNSSIIEAGIDFQAIVNTRIAYFGPIPNQTQHQLLPRARKSSCIVPLRRRNGIWVESIMPSLHVGGCTCRCAVRCVAAREGKDAM